MTRSDAITAPGVSATISVECVATAAAGVLDAAAVPLDAAATGLATAAAQRFFETLTLKTVAELPRFYGPEALFKDPFNNVRGHADIQRVFTHMFTQVAVPRFKVVTVIAGSGEAFLTWDFLFRRHGQTPDLPDLKVHGATHLIFGPDRRIVVHRDYWDAASELYEKLPVLGSLMRLIRRRLAAVPATSTPSEEAL